MVGRIFKALVEIAKPEFGKVGGVVQDAFDGLAKLNQDLKTGGVAPSPLTYDQAHSLVTLVAAIARKPLVLVLDAWEKSSALVSEFRILESFLDHRSDWPQVHIFCGIRQPELQRGAGDRAFGMAQDLVDKSPAAVLYPLGDMDLGDPAEVERLILYLHDRVPVTRKIPDAPLLCLIGGFAGVIGRWVDPEQRGQINEFADLARVASDAQKYRYRELEVLLGGLSGDQLRLAIRLAFFPRLDTSTWDRFRLEVLDGLVEELWFDLARSHVLESPECTSSHDFPSYGHDTRHWAAQQWFVGRPHLAPWVLREVDALVFRLAARVRCVDEENRGYGEALRAVSAATAALGLPDRCRVLLASAECLFKGADEAAWDFLDTGRYEAPALSGSVAPLLTQAIYNRAWRKAMMGDMSGAIADNTAVIELPGAPPDPAALALVNRGRCRGEQGDSAGAVADYTTAVKLPGAPPEAVARGCANLGFCFYIAGRTAEAMPWLNRALAMAELLPDKGEQVKRVLEELQQGEGPGAENEGKG